MARSCQFNTVLVPTDFSTNSRAAFERALELVEGQDAAVVVLHVVDSSLAQVVADYEGTPAADVIKKMRRQAEQRLQEYEPPPDSSVEVQRMLCDGTPFMEIIDHARDLLVDAVLIGKVGSRGRLEKLLFGSTVEKVIRGCARPVIVLPEEEG